MTDEDYDCAAIEVSLALAHMNWVSMHADAAANIAALDTNTLNQYVLWESDSLPMKNAALAASYWVARRAMSIMITTARTRRRARLRRCLVRVDRRNRRAYATRWC